MFWGYNKIKLKTRDEIMLYFIGMLIYLIVISVLIYLFFYVRRKKKFKIRKMIYVSAPTLKQRIIWGVTILQFTVVCFLLFIGGTLFMILIQKELIIPNHALLYVVINNMYVFSIAWLFISIPLAGVILMLFHHEDYDYVAEYKGQPSGRIEENFTPLMVMLILIFILAFPFCILGAGSYFYFSDTYIGTDQLWSISEQQYRYEDIKEVQVRYNRINNDYDFYYEIYFNDKVSEDIFIERFNNIKRADEILQSQGVKINREVISENDYRKMKSIFTQDFMKTIETIFDIEEKDRLEMSNLRHE